MNNIDPFIRVEIIQLIIAIVRQAEFDAACAITRSKAGLTQEEKEDAIAFLGNCRYKDCVEILREMGLSARQIEALRKPDLGGGKARVAGVKRRKVAHSALKSPSFGPNGPSAE